MSSRRSLLSPLPRLLVLAAVLGALLLLHGAEGATARPLLGIIAEPPASPAGAVAAAAAAGPGAAAAVAGEGGRHRRGDRSEAGAEVILAGFAAALIVVVFCYIRVTREQSSSGGVGVGAEKHASLGGF